MPYQPTSKERDFTENIGNQVTLDLVLIPGGSFWMGTKDEEIKNLCKNYDVRYNFDAETPQHQVRVTTFLMGRYPITQEQWRIVAGWEKIIRELDTDPSQFKSDYEKIERWQRPVEGVSWEDAQEFCRRLSKKTQKEYCLPTEAQWEYACRGVAHSSLATQNLTKVEWNDRYNQPFHFGETISTQLANYNGNYTYGTNSQGEDRGQTTPVGYFQVANNFGLYDLHGNTWEWCEDDYHINYQGAPEDGSAWVSKASSIKVIRGGSCFLSPRYCRSACRAWDTSTDSGSGFGFRVVCVASKNV
jgi:formylglycine-generating enzyme required for sulfatase activity